MLPIAQATIFTGSKNKNDINIPTLDINGSWNATYSGSFLRLKEESADPRAWGQIKLNVNGKKATLNIDSYVENVQKEMEIISESADQLKLKDVSANVALNSAK